MSVLIDYIGKRRHVDLILFETFRDFWKSLMFLEKCVRFWSIMYENVGMSIWSIPPDTFLIFLRKYADCRIWKFPKIFFRTCQLLINYVGKRRHVDLIMFGNPYSFWKCVCFWSITPRRVIFCSDVIFCSRLFRDDVIFCSKCHFLLRASFVISAPDMCHFLLQVPFLAPSMCHFLFRCHFLLPACVIFCSDVIFCSRRRKIPTFQKT